MYLQAVIVLGNGSVSERVLTDQGTSNRLLAPSVTVVSSVVAKGVRTVVLTRAMRGLTPQYYSFRPVNHTL